MNTIPFFTNTNRILQGKYAKFFHTASYLTKKSDQFDSISSENDFQSLMDKCGYAKRQKFVMHRGEWNSLGRKIPKSYLDAIGVDIHTLSFTLELDREEFDKVLNTPFSPEYATIRILPGIYQSIPLPEGITEEEAIEVMQLYVKEKNLRCFINLPEIKSIRFEPDGHVSIYHFPPVIQESKHWMIPSEYVQIP